MSRFFWIVQLFLLFGLEGTAQRIAGMEFLAAVEVPYDFSLKQTAVGGLSGLTRSGEVYYVVADKPPARLYRLAIDYSNNSLTIDWLGVVLLKPGEAAGSELESLVPVPGGEGFYLSDEQKKGTRILQINEIGQVLRVVMPRGSDLMPLSDYNSGIEGLALSPDGRYLYYAFERPTLDCGSLSLVAVKKLDLSTGNEAGCYYYQLAPVAGDKQFSNGISEIATLTDSTLLVMERAYIPGRGNVVRLFEVGLPAGPGYCDDENRPLPKRMVFDFDSVADFSIDNAEGMCFNSDRSLLYLITDNNFNSRQRTQIIALRVLYERD